MKHLLVLPAWLLLLWTLTAFASANEGKGSDIQVKKLGSDKIELVCPFGTTIKSGDKDEKSLQLNYTDEKSGEYACTDDANHKYLIYVKFRTCDNCIELDVGSIVGLAVGDLLATAVIGVAVYLIASQARLRPITSHQNKGSDRQHLVPNEMTSRASNDHYERLRHKGQKETYDVINKR